MKQKMMCCLVWLMLTLMSAGTGWTYELLSGPTGMIVHDDEKAFNGYTLYTPEGGNYTYLINMEGEIVHTWPPLGNPTLLKNGTIFGIYGDRHDYGDLVIMDWSGNVTHRWEAPQELVCSDGVHPTAFHHDWKVIEGSPHVPAGEKSILAVARVGRLPQEVEAGGFEASTGGFGAIAKIDPVTGETIKYADTDALLEFDMDGNLVWVWEFWDHMFQTQTPDTSHYYPLSKEDDQAVNPDPFDRMYFKKLFATSIGGDSTHTNAIDFNAERMEVLMNPVHKAGFFVFKFNTTTEEARGEKGDFVYRWGDPSMYDIHAVPSGVATYLKVSKRTGASEVTDYGKHDSMIGGSHNVHWIPEGLPGEGNFLIFSNAGSPYLEGGSAIVEVNPYTNDAFLNPDTNWKIDAYVPQDFGTDGYADQSLRSIFLGGSPRNTAKFSKQMVMYFTPRYAFGQYEKAGFYSGHISGCQRLPNGNTLVCAGEAGHFFEITKPEKFADTELGLDLMLSGVFTYEDCFNMDLFYRNTKVVWEFVNPYSLPRENERTWYEDLAEATDTTYTVEGTVYEHRPAGVDSQVFRAIRYATDYPGIRAKGNVLPPLGAINHPEEWESKANGISPWMFNMIGGSTGGSGGSGGAAGGGVGGGAGY